MNEVLVDPNRPKLFHLFGAMLLAATLKCLLIILDVVPFNSDEAVVGLMARHILQGERPIFFYGQAYMGSLDAWLVAGAFRFLGESVLSIRIIQIVLYLLFMMVLWLLARRISHDPRLPGLVVWLAAVPSVMVATYTTISLGGYGEILVLGNLILLLGYEVIYGQWTEKWWAWLLLGLVGGLAFWTLGMAGVFLIPVAVAGLWKLRLRSIGQYAVCLVGFISASSPWWVQNLILGGAGMQVLLKSSLPPSTLFTNLIVFLLFGIPSVLGLRAPWSPDYPPLPILFAFLVFYSCTAWYLIRGQKRRDLPMARGVVQLFGLLILVFAGLVIFSNYGIDITGRYYLPLFVPLVLGSALFISAAWTRKRIWGVAILTLVLLLNAIEIGRVAASPAKFTDQFTEITIFDNSHDQELIDFLRQQGELRGYTNYWVSFRLAFLSQEEILYAAKIPYKVDFYYNPANDRYPAYSRAVDSSDRVAYITTKHLKLDERIRQGFMRLGVTFEETQIGDFHVFYRLSRPVRPVELGL